MAREDDDYVSAERRRYNRENWGNGDDTCPAGGIHEWDVDETKSDTFDTYYVCRKCGDRRKYKN